jgi:ribonucleotide reductase alpha subunit
MQKIPWGPIGEAVYRRTYSLDKPDGQKELWPETVSRATNGNCDMVPPKFIEPDERQKLIDLMLPLGILPGGRHLNASGVKGRQFVMNCLSGDTLVQTRQGLIPISSLSSFHDIEVLSMTERTKSGIGCWSTPSVGVWRKASFRSYGKQKLYEVKFSDGSTIRATIDHKWYVTKRSEPVETAKLVGLDVPFVAPPKPERNKKYEQGVLHGFVFGDGSVAIRGEQVFSSYVQMFAEKDLDLVPLFEKHGYEVTYPDYCEARVGKLPSEWKSLPPNDASASYWLGFINGLLAADGTVDKGGSIFIYQSDKEVLETLSKKAQEVGYVTSPIYLQRANNPWTGEPAACWRLNLRRFSVSEEDLVLSHHRLNFLEAGDSKVSSMKVVEVNDLHIEEEVFCATEPETHTFVIGNNILTGNCHAAGFDPSEPWAHFSFVFDALMQGGGVGSNYSNRYIEKMPPIHHSVDLHIICDQTHPNHHEFAHLLSKHDGPGAPALFVVPDSREGWVQALELLCVMAWRPSPEKEVHLVIDVSKIRARGTPLKTSGGIACGPGPLVELLTDFSRHLNGCVGRRLTSLDMMTLDHHIAEGVIAGGKRRSSRISVKNWSDPDIMEFINCKRVDGAHWTTNISVEVDSDFFDAYEFKDQNGGQASAVMQAIVLGTRNNGEPGIWNRSLAQEGEREPEKMFTPNPCQPAWATQLTPEGISTMGAIEVGSTVWSGKRWTKVIRKRCTGIKKVYAYRTRAGTFIGTENHRVVSNGEKIEAQFAESIDTAVGESNLVGPVIPQDVLDGLVLGDGMVHKASNDLVTLLIGKKDGALLNPDSEVRNLIGRHRPGITEEAYEVETTLTPDEVPLTYERKIPTRFLLGGWNKKLSFLRGLYSANGSIVANRVTLKASSMDVIDGVQMMLSSIGISSYYTINEAHETTFKNGSYMCRQSYDLNISTDRRKFRDLIGFIQPDKQARLIEACELKFTGQKKTNYEITEVYYLGEHQVFDITVEADEHTYWTGGLLVSNCGEIGLHEWEACNLGHINMEYFVKRPVSEMKEAFRLMTRWLIRATFSDIAQPRQRTVIERNRRIGVGFLGFHAWLARNGVKYSECYKEEWVMNLLAEMKKVVLAESASYSQQLDIPEPVKHTTLAPTGTVALMPGTTSSGQCMMAPWYKRLVRYSSMDPELAVKKLEGYEVFDDPDAKNTEIVVYWCEDPLTAKVRAAGFDVGEILEGQYDVGFYDSLQVQKMLQRVWADNSVSYTINLPANFEMSEDVMEDYLMEALPHLKGTTVFPNKSRKNSPFQPITKDEFEFYQGRKEVFQVEDECRGGCPMGK